MDDERIDEALEPLWLMNEEDLHELERFKLSSEDDDIESLIDSLKKEGLITIQGDKINFSDKAPEIEKECSLLTNERVAVDKSILKKGVSILKYFTSLE